MHTSDECIFCGGQGLEHGLAPGRARCERCRWFVAVPHTPAEKRAVRGTTGLGPIQPGALLRDRYRLIELIGRGAHGLTYLAQHEFLNHPCVVKVLPQRIADGSDESVRRLRDEASAGFRVSHPNVVRVLDGDVLDGIWYFVMEHVDGVDLGAITRAGQVVPWRQVLRIALDAARGLEAIHRTGLLHRDIKPGNLILATDGHVRVADLGVARLLVQQRDPLDSAADHATGTLAYAAPEVFQAGHELGPPTDLYSLGVTLFELLTAALPRGDSIYQTILGGSDGQATWPVGAPSDVPQWLIECVIRLLAAEPSKRFATAGALVTHLEHAEAPAAPTAKPVGVEPKGPRGIVVLPFENGDGSGQDDWLGHAVAEHLGRSIGWYEDAYVVSGEQYIQTLERVRRYSTRSRGEQLLEAGRLVGAATVVEGSFQRAGAQVELTARVYRAGHAEAEQLGPVHGALGALAELEANLCVRLVELLALRTVQSVGAAPAPRQIDPVVEERFFTAKRAFFRGDYETARRLGLETIALDPHFGEAVGFVGVCLARDAKYEEALEYNRRHQELAAAENNPRWKLEALANLGSMHYFQGEFALANEYLTRAAAIAESLGLTTELASIQNNLGFVLLQLGREKEAEATYLRAIETLKRYGALVLLIGPYNGMGHVLLAQRRYEEAAGYFRRALALAQESDDFVNMGVASMNLGQCALLQKRLDDAKHELAAALSILEQTSFWNGLARVYEYMADLNLELANRTEAIRCIEQRIALARRHKNARMEAAARQQLERARRPASRPAPLETGRVET